MITMTASVGRNGVNKPVDVLLVRHLLNLHLSAIGRDSRLDLTGEVDDSTLQAIDSFQHAVLGRTPDGRVDPGGPTLAALSAPVQDQDNLSLLRALIGCAADTVPARPGELSSALTPVDGRLFCTLYERQFTRLDQSARAGLGDLIRFINEDKEVKDIGWAAYMLATVKHECAGKWQPIKEFGLGRGRPYGTPVTFTDAQGKRHTHTYYGRGYVQLTWQDNYRKLGRALGLGEQLLSDPDRVLEPEIAYRIMSHGMRNGTFTGRCLKDYINKAVCDYPQARRIINALDKHTLIAGYAQDLELLLRLSCGSG